MCSTKKLRVFGSFIIFLLLALGGCTPTTNVTVKCGPGMGDSEPPGLCNNYPAVGNYTGSANGFWDTSTGAVWTGSGNCAGGKRCNPNNPPGNGRCASGAPCKNWITPSTMQCKCDCTAS
jgi:hypothetical protein